MDDEAVDYEEELKRFRFKEKGNRHWDIIIKEPYKAWKVNKIKKEIDDLLQEKFSKVRKHRNNLPDAYRHALWSYRVTREFGPQVAKEMGDAHERQRENSKGERLMDLHNNQVGRELALNQASDRYMDEKMIEFAFKNGYLRTKPYLVRGEASVPQSVLGQRQGVTIFSNKYSGK